MDCRSFRKHHLAYLDDTLSGDQTAAAQRHVLSCDACAAHDTLVRRSLMIARSMREIEPSADFQARLRARLAATRDEAVPPPIPADTRRHGRTLAAMAAGALLATLAWRGVEPTEPALVAMQPVIATQPATNPFVSPALMRAMATGNPVWPAAMLLEDMPTHFVETAWSGSE
jgi:anti-sigma factor RsiW